MPCSLPICAGRTFTTADATSDVAMLDASYATQKKLTVGSTIAIGNSKGTATNFTVIGIVSEPVGDNPSDAMWRERGLTMIMVTHDSTVARRAQHLGVMKNGRLTLKALKPSRNPPTAGRSTPSPVAGHPPADPAPEPPADAITFPD